MGGLDAQLKQRYDLIPNLVSTVKQFMEHEASLLENIVKLRSQALHGNVSSKELEVINKEISRSISGIMVQVEQYPDLKSSANFVQLQDTLYEVEENIAAARRFFNAAVTDYNNALQMYPSSIFAKQMGLRKKHVFNIPEVERKAVNVQNLFDK